MDNFTAIAKNRYLKNQQTNSEISSSDYQIRKRKDKENHCINNSMLQNKRMSSSKCKPQNFKWNQSHLKNTTATTPVQQNAKHQKISTLRPPQMIIFSAARVVVQYKQNHPSILIITVGRIS
jgi:hypothetical protein